MPITMNKATKGMQDEILHPLMGGMLADAQAAIDRATRLVPLHIIVVILMLGTGIGAMTVETVLIFDLKKIPWLDIATGRFPEEAFLPTLAAALQGSLAILISEKFFNSPIRRQCGIWAGFILLLLFSTSLVIATAAGQMPMFVAAAGAAAEQAISWAASAPPAKAAATSPALLEAAWYGSNLGYLILFIVSALAFNTASEKTRIVVSSLRSRALLRTVTRSIRNHVCEADRARLALSRARETFDAQLLAATQPKMAEAAVLHRRLLTAVELGEALEIDDVNGWLVGILGPVPQELLQSSMIEDREKLRSIATKALEQLNNGYTERCFTDWKASRRNRLVAPASA